MNIGRLKVAWLGRVCAFHRTLREHALKALDAIDRRDEKDLIAALREIERHPDAAELLRNPHAPKTRTGDAIDYLAYDALSALVPKPELDEILSASES